MIGPLELIILLAVVLAPVYFVARYAESKGYNFVLFLILSLVFFWPLVVVVVLLLRDKRVQAPSPAGAAGLPGTQPGAAPGWYPDPSGAAYDWYWDGERWTEHRERE